MVVLAADCRENHNPPARAAVRAMNPLTVCKVSLQGHALENQNVMTIFFMNSLLDLDLKSLMPFLSCPNHGKEVFSLTGFSG